MHDHAVGRIFDTKEDAKEAIHVAILKAGQPWTVMNCFFCIFLCVKYPANSVIMHGAHGTQSGWGSEINASDCYVYELMGARQDAFGWERKNLEVKEA